MIHYTMGWGEKVGRNWKIGGLRFGTAMKLWRGWGSRRLLDGEGQFRFGGNLAVYAGYGLADAHGTHAAG